MDSFWFALLWSGIIWFSIGSGIALRQINHALDYAKLIPEHNARMEFLIAVEPFFWLFKTLIFLNPIKDLPEWAQVGYIEWLNGIRDTGEAE